MTSKVPPTVNITPMGNNGSRQGGTVPAGRDFLAGDLGGLGNQAGKDVRVGHFIFVTHRNSGVGVGLYGYSRIPPLRECGPLAATLAAPATLDYARSSPSSAGRFLWPT